MPIYDAQYDSNMTQGQMGAFGNTNTPAKESPMAVLDRGVGRVAEMVMRLETMSDRLAGTRPEVVSAMAGGGVPAAPAVAHQINSHGIALDNMARRMQSALDRIEQAFG